MHSILFQIGPLAVRSYGLCMAAGFLAGWWAMARLCRKTGRDASRLSTLLTWLMLSAVAGARAAYVLEHWKSEFAAAPLSVFRIDQGGLMFYGGVIGAALALGIYARVVRQRAIELTDLVLTALPLGHAFGRVGCFFHGCCYGRLTDSCIGVCFPKGSPAWFEQVDARLIPPEAARCLPVIPAQLIEAGANLLLFLALFSLYPKWSARPGRASGCYLMAYACIRFSTECLRGDPRLAVGPFSIGQAISLALLLCGALFLAASFRKPRPEE